MVVWQVWDEPLTRQRLERAVTALQKRSLDKVEGACSVEESLKGSDHADNYTDIDLVNVDLTADALEQIVWVLYIFPILVLQVDSLKAGLSRFKAVFVRACFSTQFKSSC